MPADVGRRCEERVEEKRARWSGISTAPDSISAVVPAVGLPEGMGAVEMLGEAVGRWG